MKAVTLRGEGAEIFMATVFTAMQTIRAVLWYPGIKQLSCGKTSLDKQK
ncbi:MAG: hypothetical protein WCJ37_17460 [Syntrophus sp. (in: bacteria)]